MPTTRPAAPPPILHALVLADIVSHDAVTGKYSISGVFMAISAPAPLRVNGFGIYMSVGSLRGPTELRLELLDPDDVPMLDARFRVEAPGPLADVEIGATSPPVTFPRHGVYRLRLSVAGGDVIGERRLMVGPVDPEPGSSPG